MASTPERVRDRRAVAWPCVLACLLAVGSAHAQPAPEDLGAAQALFDSAAALIAEGRHAEACPKLEEVVRLVPDGLGARLRLADCYEKAGKLASAWTAFTFAEEAARRTSDDTRARFARERAQALQPRLLRVRIDVAEATRAVPELVVKRDGRVVRAPEWGVAVPVDAGKHEIVAEAPGHVTFRAEIDVATSEVRVEIPALARDTSTPAPLAPAAPPAKETGAPSPPPNMASEGGVPAWAWVSGGAGLAFGAVAVGFLVDQLSIQSDIDRNCTDEACKESFDSKGANDRLYRDNGFAVGFGAASLIGIGAAVVGIATAPQANVAVSRDSVNVTWGGVF
jgi:hypothetical protein